MMTLRFELPFLKLKQPDIFWLGINIIDAVVPNQKLGFANCESSCLIRCNKSKSHRKSSSFIGQAKGFDNHAKNKFRIWGFEDRILTHQKDRIM